ncbi:MAG: tetratricopeptide repeat protein [Limisphaerales bacterium]
MFDFSRGDFDNAIAKLKSVLAAEPAHFDAQLALGMAYYRQGNYARRLPKATKRSNCDPRNNSFTRTFLCFT